ncbi:hypothetical protein EI94DRAFT_1808733 [Lactarius quietus]|nr:hypothetical protein EI94DRAFT_1808733 [Lactarius quietus]
MSSSSQTLEPPSQVKSILDAALSEYQTKTGKDLINNSLAKELQGCESVEAVLGIIQREAKAFEEFRDSDKWLMKWIGPSVNVLYTISPILGAAVSKPFPPASAVFTGIGVLLAVRSSVFFSGAPFIVDIFQTTKYVWHSHDTNYHSVTRPRIRGVLDVFDPEQNLAFNLLHAPRVFDTDGQKDHYLNVPDDHSQIFFICTGTQPLFDRCEIIQLYGHKHDEQLHVEGWFPLSKQLTRNGLSEAHIQLTEPLLLPQACNRRNYTQKDDRHGTRADFIPSDLGHPSRERAGIALDRKARTTNYGDDRRDHAPRMSFTRRRGKEKVLGTHRGGANKMLVPWFAFSRAGRAEALDACSKERCRGARFVENRL